jgi:alpha,alpha-trehalase
MAGSHRPIRDYAVIGDCHGSALVSREGSIDWCCLERFDADPVCCRILDSERGGFLAVRPAGAFTASRAYIEGTNILQTTFTTASGVVTVTDFMPVGGRPGAGTHDYVRLNAPGWLIRIIAGEQGHAALDVAYRPSVDFARRAAHLVDEPGVVRAENGKSREEPCLYHDAPELHSSGDAAHGSLQIQAGAQRVLVLIPRPADGSPLERAGRLLAITRAFWSEWIAYCRYDDAMAGGQQE